MGFLIDTNVLSELRKRERGNEGVRRWYEGVTGDDLYVSVMVLGEIRNGVERLRRRDPSSADVLEQWLGEVEREMADRILPVTARIADRWGRMGIPDKLPVVDALLAATAIEHGLTLVTRNVDDVSSSGAQLINPFK